MTDDIFKINLGPRPDKRPMTLEQRIEPFIRQPATEEAIAQIRAICRQYVAEMEEELGVELPVRTGVTAGQLRAQGLDPKVADEAEAVLTANVVDIGPVSPDGRIQVTVGPTGMWEFNGRPLLPMERSHAEIVSRWPGLFR